MDRFHRKTANDRPIYSPLLDPLTPHTLPEAWNLGLCDLPMWTEYCYFVQAQSEEVEDDLDARACAEAEALAFEWWHDLDAEREAARDEAGSACEEFAVVLLLLAGIVSMIVLGVNALLDSPQFMEFVKIVTGVGI